MTNISTYARIVAVIALVMFGGVFVSNSSKALPWNAEQAVRQCFNTFTVSGSWYDKNNYDYCDVDEGFFFGKDVGLRHGRQLDVIDVVRQLKHYYANDAVTQRERRLSKDLGSCLRNYRALGGKNAHGTDRCRVWAGGLTAEHWGLNGRRRGSVELWRALSAALGTFAESATSGGTRHWGYVERPRRHGERHSRHAWRHGEHPQSAHSSVLSRTCQYHFGPKAGLREYFPPTVPIKPAPVGWPCWDGFASHGTAVPD